MYGDLEGPRKAFLETAVCTRFQREKGQREQQMKRPQDREQQSVFQDTAKGLCGWTLGTGWESGGYKTGLLQKVPLKVSKPR